MRRIYHPDGSSSLAKPTFDEVKKDLKEEFVKAGIGDFWHGSYDNATLDELYDLFFERQHKILSVPESERSPGEKIFAEFVKQLV